MEARPEIKPKAVKAIIEEVKAHDADYNVPLTENGRKLWHLGEKAAKELDAEKMLKYCVGIQRFRVERMLQWEDKMGLTLPEGYKEMAALTNIAAELLKHELGQVAFRVKKPPSHSSPSDSAFPQQESKSVPTPAQISDSAKFDRDKWRAAAARMAAMLGLQEDTNA